MFSNKKIINIIGIVFLITLCILSYSATFIILFFAICFLFIIIKFNKLFFSLVLICIYILLNTNYVNYDFIVKINNLANLTNTINLSSLTYLYGIESAINNILNSGLFGLGINMMGCDTLSLNINMKYFYENLLIELSRITSEGKVVNYNDGSFLLSKYFSEIGIFSILFIIILYLYPIYKLYLLIRNNKYSESFFNMLFVFFILI